MKSIQYITALCAATLLSACGGGSPDKDSATFSVQPSEFTYKPTTAQCTQGSVGGDSIHTINGGQQPFRVRVSIPNPGLEVGLASSTNQFVAAVKNAQGDLIVNGRDPKFAVRAALTCGSSVSVLVLDDTSALVSVKITTEEGTAAP
jgi:hypothetical protein